MLTADWLREISGLTPLPCFGFYNFQEGHHQSGSSNDVNAMHLNGFFMRRCINCTAKKRICGRNRNRRRFQQQQQPQPPWQRDETFHKTVYRQRAAHGEPRMRMLRSRRRRLTAYPAVLLSLNSTKWLTSELVRLVKQASNQATNRPLAGSLLQSLRIWSSSTIEITLADRSAQLPQHQWKASCVTLPCPFLLHSLSYVSLSLSLSCRYCVSSLPANVSRASGEW